MNVFFLPLMVKEGEGDIDSHVPKVFIIKNKL